MGDSMGQDGNPQPSNSYSRSLRTALLTFSCFAWVLVALFDYAFVDENVATKGIADTFDPVVGPISIHYWEAASYIVFAIILLFGAIVCFGLSMIVYKVYQRGSKAH